MSDAEGADATLHSRFIEEPPQTERVMAEAKLSQPNSLLTTRRKADRLVLEDGLDETREVMKGIRDGPRERESARAYVRRAICAG